jgi:hypothetical protein
MKRNKFSILIFLSWLAAACGGFPSSDYDTILNHQPYVVNLTPAPDQVLDRLDRIEITFSQPINPETLNDKSVLVVQGKVDPQQYADASDLLSDVKGSILTTIPGSISAAEDLKKIAWAPERPLEEGNVTLVVTPKLEGDRHIPFNQKPGEAPTPLFAIFSLSKGNETSAGPGAFGGPSGMSSENPTPKKRPVFLVLNEILYDAAGSDTDGNEFIELYGTPDSDLDGYQVILVNGSDGGILDTITLPKNSRTKSDGLFLIADSQTNQSTQTNVLGTDRIDNFDPQNGPDAVQLLDDQGRLLDALSYGDGAVATAHNGLNTGEGSPAADVGSGHSLSRVNGIDTDDNATDFMDLDIPTPGVL